MVAGRLDPPCSEYGLGLTCLRKFPPQDKGELSCIYHCQH